LTWPVWVADSLAARVRAGVAVAVAVAVAVLVAVAPAVAVAVWVAAVVGAGVAIVVSTGDGKGVSVVSADGAAVGVSVAVSVGEASAAAAAGVGVSVWAAAAAAVAAALGVGVGSSAGAGVPSTAAKTAALARAVTKMRRSKSSTMSAGGPPRLNPHHIPHARLEVHPRRSAIRSAPMDVAALDIRIAGPNDAGALAGTTRLGFESYREWAPAGWRPPPRSLEIRSIRERLKQSSTWCAMALDDDGEPAGHVGITHAAERERAHVRIPGRAHLWMLFVRPSWWGSGLATRLHTLALEEAVREGYESIRLYTPAGQARARAFYEREGWALASRAFAEPLLGLDLVEYRRSLSG
jgi:GNAT superfamily N-acetyltransferase